MCYSALVKKDIGFLERTFAATLVRETMDHYARAVALDSKKWPPFEMPRIFPGHYAPVVWADESGRKLVEPMRYGVWPPAFVKDPQRYTTFNARRDNLNSPFWSECWRQHHGILVVEGFYERS